MEFDPELKYVFSPNGGDGTLTVIHEDSPDKYSIVENVKTQVRARTMAIDTKTHKVYLPIAQFGAASRYKRESEASGADGPGQLRDIGLRQIAESRGNNGNGNREWIEVRRLRR